VILTLYLKVKYLAQDSETCVFSGFSTFDSVFGLQTFKFYRCLVSNYILF